MVRKQLGRVVLRCFEDGTLSAAVRGRGETALRGSANVAAAAQACLLQRRGIVLPAQEESYDTEPTGASYGPAPLTYVDRVGAVSVIPEDDEPVQEGIFQNRDGHRFEDGRYAAFTKVRLYVALLQPDRLCSAFWTTTLDCWKEYGRRIRRSFVAE